MAEQPSSAVTLLHMKPSTPAATTTTANSTSDPNPLPQLLQTPAGLALLELQGTINLPLLDPHDTSTAPVINIGRLDFPDYKPDSITFDPASTAWMKRVYMFVGQHQRLTGEVKKLPRAMGVVRRRPGTGKVGAQEELEIVEVIKHKIVFSSRPEPVGTA
ncbi:Ctf8-domain-containing protein [Coniella lustricola]|uniref:Ctf8-domain-containing protein n=1 Tax=Coniella lustricola TaxID=2025994 RepID=A0A2T2ZYR4_9PEZI|nr:Ctf8-domain-containing protein [Coniella lustricola]